MDQQCTVDIEHDVVAAGKKVLPKQDVPKPLALQKDFMKPWWIEDGQSKELLMLLQKKDQFTWDEVVVMVLHMIRCREFTKYDPKTDLVVPTRFCLFNIAFFDLNKESEVVPRPPISKIPVSDLWRLEDSVNVISVKVAESDVGYPINIYGTVLARDEYDYRCIYLFKRGRDNPQLITSPEDTLTLTGPYRAFAVTGNMFFEVHLKIKSDGAINKDFNKALKQHNTSHHTREPMTVSLVNCLSTVVMVYSPVTCAVEASLEVNILNGASNFTGKIAAWTTVSDEAIILYDSEVAGTDTNLGIGGSVKLSRRIVAVPLDEGLVLNVSDEDECLEFDVWHDFEDDFEHTCMLGPYELQLKVSWTAVERRRRHKMLEDIGQVQVLW